MTNTLGRYIITCISQLLPDRLELIARKLEASVYTQISPMFVTLKSNSGQLPVLTLLHFSMPSSNNAKPSALGWPIKGEWVLGATDEVAGGQATTASSGIRVGQGGTDGNSLPVKRK